MQITLTEPERDDWSMTGNTGSNPASNFIGTTDNKDLVIKTNSLERMRIGNDGKITSSSYWEKLYANRISSFDSVIYIGDSTLIFNGNNQTIYGANSGTYKGLGLGNSQNRCIGTGAVGIGVVSQANGDRSVSIGFGVRTTASQAITIGSGITSNNFLNNTASNSLWVGFNSNIPTLVVSQANGAGTTGNVGIGMTPNASYKLDVKGNIRACDVLVNHVNGCDYVFETKYKLMEVSDLKAYLNANKHLPDIAPAKEMESLGIEVGTFSTALLKKVEELTLYMISQNEKIEYLTKQNERLELKLNGLKK